MLEADRAGAYVAFVVRLDVGFGVQKGHAVSRPNPSLDLAVEEALLVGQFEVLVESLVALSEENAAELVCLGCVDVLVQPVSGARLADRVLGVKEVSEGGRARKAGGVRKAAQAEPDRGASGVNLDVLANVDSVGTRVTLSAVFLVDAVLLVRRAVQDSVVVQVLMCAAREAASVQLDLEVVQEGLVEVESASVVHADHLAGLAHAELVAEQVSVDHVAEWASVVCVAVLAYQAQLVKGAECSRV